MKKYFAALALGIITAGSASVAAAQISAPPLPDLGNVNQIGSDALSKFLDTFTSFKNIEAGTKSLTDRVAQGNDIISSIKNGWVSANDWVQGKIGVSIRTIIQFIGYVLIFVAVLWIKLISWILSVI